MHLFHRRRPAPRPVGAASGDTELIAAVAAGQQEALQLLHPRHAPWLRAAALPPAVRRLVPAIRQQTASWSWAVAPARGTVPIGLAWNRADDDYRLWLAGSVAATATGLRVEEACDARGQARAVVALTPIAATYGPAEVLYAQRLRAEPDARTRVWSHWDELMRLPLAQALPPLGLDADIPIAAPEGKRCA